ncbi:hypothetical protein XPA_000670 [Xanthoria parietina]
MATVIANKPAPPHQKLKRPPSAVPTNTNGVKTSQSPSPSLAHKRLPSTMKHPAGASGVAVNGSNGLVPAAARLNNRRRESQKPGDIQPRSTRPSKGGQGDNNSDKRKKLAEPYVNMTTYILKKFKNKQPSLIIHLHPTHFRFDQQDGSFSYNSPMKFLLQHLRSQTIPHDMIEELNAAAVKYYEGCLIVQVQDHRTIGSNSQPPSSTATNDKNVPFSIHNYNEHLTPSPFVPYPRSAIASDTSPKIESSKSDTGKTEKETMQGDSKAQKCLAKSPRIFTTVLFPTQQSTEEELYILANTPDPRSNNRKQSQASASNRTPASTTMPHPPTPLSAVPPTPSAGPPAKKQKMLLKESDMRALQTNLTTSSAHPLYLDPVDSLQEVSKLIQCLTDSFHKGNLPSPTTRKRTVAELEADEAQAASEQRFMLIMDERLAASAVGAKAGGNDGEAGAAVFEPRFERFKTIESIKAAHREKEQQMQEARAQQQAAQQAANKLKQEHLEQQKLIMEKRNADAHREQQIRSLQAAQNAQNAQNAQQQKPTMASLQHQQQQLAATQNPHGHGPNGTGIMANQQNMPANSQPPHSSPVSRHMTPHSNPRSSPMVGPVPHSVPMNVTSSGQGITSSPARPPSAAQHGHPAGGVAMVAKGSQQRPPSRMGTPSMPNGTPGMQHGTPVIKQGTPTPRINQGSPQNGMPFTPMLGSSGIAAQHINGQPITPEMQEQYHRARQLHIQQQQARAIQQHQQQNMANGMSPNHGMAPMHMPPQTPNLQHLAAQNQHVRAYQVQQAEHHRQMNGNGGPNQMQMPVGTPNPYGRPMPPQPPHPSAPVGNPSPQQQQLRAQQSHAARMQMAYQQRAFADCMKPLMQQYGSQAAVPPELLHDARQKAVMMAKGAMVQQQRQHQAQMMAAQRAGAMAGGGGMNGINGMNGMNGMSGMSGMSGINGMNAMSGMNGMAAMNGMGGMGGMNGMGGMGGMGGMQ